MFGRRFYETFRIIVFVTLVLCCVPVRALAQAAPAKTGDELIAGYIEQRLEAQLEANRAPRLRARPAIGLDGNDASLYWYLKEMIAEVAAGERTSTVFEVPVGYLCYQTSWTAQELGLESVLVDGQISDEAMEAAYATIDFDLSAVMNALEADCTYELYWYDKTYGVGVRKPWVSASYSNGEWTVGFGRNAAIVFSFSVSADYSADGNLGTTQVDPTCGQRVSTAVETAARVAASGSDLSAYGRLYFFKEWICDAVSYNYTAAQDDDMPYGDPWQLIYVFDGDRTTNVVCEGYSKAFQYLCDLAQIPDVDCYCVTGRMGGGTGSGAHMWNLVGMDDGRMYLVDVTNCDAGSIGYPDALFIVPYLRVAGDNAYYAGKASSPVLYVYDSDTLSTFQAAELALSRLPYGERDITASGTWGSCPWEIEDGDHLYVYPGAGADQGSQNRSPWYGYESDIKTVSFVAQNGQKVIAPQKCGYLFAQFSACTSFDLSGLDTSNATDMEGMFFGCGSAETLDISSFDTRAATDMSAMFDGMTSLQSFTVGEFFVQPTENGCWSCPSGQWLAESDGQVYELYELAHRPGPDTYTLYIEPDYERIERCRVIVEGDIQTWTGEPLEPAVRVINGDGAVLVEGVDYELAYADNVEPGEATVTVTGIGNFRGEITTTFSIVAPIQPVHAPGWANEGGNWYFYGSDGAPMTDHWESYGGSWYYFGDDGRLVWNGWSYYEGVRYYMGSNGQLARNTWASVDGRYYYIGSNYRPLTNGWATYGGRYYYLGADGTPQQTGWVYYGGKYYYLRNYTPVVNQWVLVGDTYYHFNKSAACDNSWKG